MPYSFNFPHRTLLHKRIEDQWFDRSPKETQSTLTALEAAEEAYHQRLARIVTPEVPPIVLGRTQHQNSVRQQQLRAQQQQQQQQLLAAEHQHHHPGISSGSGRNRRSSVSAAETAESSLDHHHHHHHHDVTTDDISTVVNPNGQRNRGRQQQQQHQQHQGSSHAYHDTSEPVMFWNRTRSRRSAGGDR